MGRVPTKVFWVGSVRERSAVWVVDYLYTLFESALLTLPHGEGVRLETWAMDTLARTQDEVPGHEIVIPGTSDSYNALRRVTYVGNGSPNIKPGLLPVVAEATELRAAIRLLQHKVGSNVTLPPAHLGSIDPAAWTEYTYATHEEAVKHLPVYRWAYTQAMNQACRKGGFAAQIESPHALVSVLTAPKHQRKQVAMARAREIVGTAAMLDVPVRIHPCYGDFGGRAWPHIETLDLEALVLLVNAIMELWPKGRDLPLSILLPMAAGNFTPSTDKLFYAPLRDIDSRARVVIGSIRPEVGADANFKALMLAADALRDCTIEAFSLPCGAGRLDEGAFQKVIMILQECLRRLVA